MLNIAAQQQQQQAILPELELPHLKGIVRCSKLALANQVKEKVMDMVAPFQNHDEKIV